MLKHLVALVLLSISTIFFMSYAAHGLHGLIMAHDWVASLLTNVFSPGSAGNISRHLIALLALPIIIALTTTLVYWLVRKNWFPYFMNVVWAVWLIQVGAILVSFGQIQ